MLKNYFKILWRNFLKDRQFSFLNLIGLSTGLACAIMIYFWIQDELKVDHYNVNDKRIYQVLQNMPGSNGLTTHEFTQGLLAKSLKEQYPEVEFAATVVPASWFEDKGMISFGDTFIKTRGEFASKDFLDIFSIPFLEGDKEQLLADKFNIAISEDMAMKLFHTTKNVIGKSIKWDHREFSGQYIIAAVYKNLPSNASNQFDLLFSFDIFFEKRPGLDNWDNSDPNTFVLLKEGVNAASFNSKIKNFLSSKLKTVPGKPERTLLAQRYSDKYLYNHYENGVPAGGRIMYVKLFTAIAIFIVLIACINFMNLSTAKANRRIKEVGIKKVMGASRRTIILQYFGESMLMTCLALALAIVMIASLIQPFNLVTGKHLTIDINSNLVLILLTITLATGLLAGSYPALYLSGFKPAIVLKGKLSNSFSEVWIRKGLVVFQFVLSAIFILSVLVMTKQIDYIQSKNLGYNRDNIIHFEIPFGMAESDLKKAESFIAEAKNVPGVLSVGSYFHNLTGAHGGTPAVEWEGQKAGNYIDFANLEVGYGFTETLGLEMKEGTGFKKDLQFDRQIMFNESAIAAMGLKNPLGKTIKLWGQEKQIVGITKDFHFESLYTKVKPVFIQVPYPIMPNVMVKVSAGTERQSIEALQIKYAEFYKNIPFDFKFMDDDYQAMYTAEKRISVLSWYFAALAIIISCLGLFGLAAFTASRRQKEIGIRKVIGASVSNVVLMLSKDFLQLVGVAVLIAFPAAWWAMNYWLSGFAYRTSIGAGVFIATGFAVLLITLCTISFQSIKAALANPVKSLKTE